VQPLRDVRTASPHLVPIAIATGGGWGGRTLAGGMSSWCSPLLSFAAPVGEPPSPHDDPDVQLSA
jgi:hypothetical protein